MAKRRRHPQERFGTCAVCERTYVTLYLAPSGQWVCADDYTGVVTLSEEEDER